MRSFGILPAAGHSRRMGRPKLLLPWGKTTVIESVLQTWQSTRVSAVVVVVRQRDQRLAEVCRMAGADTILAPAPREMKDSVQLALEHIGQVWKPTREDAWLLAPADMPSISRTTINEVLASHDPKHPRILVPQYSGRRGHPVLFPWPLSAEVGQLSAGQGVDALLARHDVRRLKVADPTILQDLDTPLDYQHSVGRTPEDQPPPNVR